VLLASYLQPGSLTVCPGGWHFAPASFGLLTPRCPFMRSVHQLCWPVNRSANGYKTCCREVFETYLIVAPLTARHGPRPSTVMLASRVRFLPSLRGALPKALWPRREHA
jgi:hypothetical protein